MNTAQLKSLEDLHKYAQDVAARRPEDDPKVQKLQVAKQTVWLFLLTCMFLFYYLIDKMGEALLLL
jgi:hypothetical protein